MNNLERTLNFYCENEITTFKQSDYYAQLDFLTQKLNYKLIVSFGYGLDEGKKIFLDFKVVNNMKEIVYVNDLDYEHLCDATCLIEYDNKQRFKFFSWEEDNDFIDSIKWVINELKLKLKNSL